MGHNIRGVDSVTGRSYGVSITAIPKSEHYTETKKLICKEEDDIGLLFLSGRGPLPTKDDDLIVRKHYNISGQLDSSTKQEMQKWLESRLDFPLSAKTDALRLMFDAFAGFAALQLRLDVIISGRNREITWDDIIDVDVEDDDEDAGPISDEAYKGLECLRVTEKGECKDCCCLEENKEMKSGSLVIKLPCCDVFHQSCILDWLFEHCYCPVCRYKFPTQDYTEYQCVCASCLYSLAIDPLSTPDHDPPFVKYL